MRSPRAPSVLAAVVAMVAAVAACGGATTSASSDPPATPADASASDAHAHDGPACTLLDDLKLSPRDDAEAEQLAFEAAATLTAPTDVYTRIHADLAAVRAQFPDVASIQARPSWEPDHVDMVVDDIGFAAMNAGTYAAWDCPNATYGMSAWTGTASHANNYVVLRFGGRRLNLPIVANAYASLPNQVSKATADIPVGDGSDVCASHVGDTYSYVFKKGDGDCPAGCTEITYWGFTTRPDGSIEFLGTFGPAPGASPAWLNALATCRKWL